MPTKRSKDYDLRAALTRELLRQGVARMDIRHEMPLNSHSSDGRVDVLLLHRDMLHGIEIKSGSDKLDRLKDQCRALDRACDYTSAMIDVRHHATDEWVYRPSRTWWWSTEAGFVELYRAEPSPWTPRLVQYHERMNSKTAVPRMTRLLWRDEAIWAAKRLAGATCGHRTRYDALDFMKEFASLKELRPLVCAALRGRELNNWEAGFWSRFDAEPGDG